MQEKQYTFTITQQNTMLGVVTATSKEEAIKKIKDDDYDDIIDSWYCGDPDYDSIEIQDEEDL